MWDEIRSKAYEALRSRSGSDLLPVRVMRGTLNFMNDMLGRPLAPSDEINERRAYEQRRREQLAQASALKPRIVATAAREAAPVIMYTDSRSGRDKSRVADVLRGKEIPFTELSVDEDESTRSWVTSTARTSDLPVVFIAGKPVGGYDAIIQLDVKGELEKLVWN